MSKVAVVLFNLGGPDGPAAVQPFLFNLFNDPAIIGAPGPIRWLLAKFISTRRAPVAREIYEHLGGGSPLLANTEAQAKALEAALNGTQAEATVRVFICMRYWHPMSDAVVRDVKAFAPDRIVLLPLYPQFSTTTSRSSVRDWQAAAARVGLSAETRTLCCYPTEDGFVEEAARRVAEGLREAAATGRPRLLFSAHGLPKKIVAKGDPYQWQVEQSAAAVVARLHAMGLSDDDFEWLVCYQSRVGPLEWIGPSTDEEIERAGGEGVPLVVVPIAFVSEHSETLVELDIEYRKLAEEAGVPAYVRVPTVADGAAFVQGLARLVQQALGDTSALVSQDGGRLCPAACGQCPQATGMAA